MTAAAPTRTRTRVGATALPPHAGAAVHEVDPSGRYTVCGLRIRETWAAASYPPSCASCRQSPERWYR